MRSLPKSSTADNRAQKSQHLRKYLQHKSFPFIYQALTKPYCTVSFAPPAPLPPPHLRFIDFTIYHMSRWERSGLYLNHDTNMRVIYCFKNHGPI